METVGKEQLSSKQVHAQIQKQKHYEKVWNMFKVNNKNSRTASIFHTFSNVSIVDFEQVNVCWDMITIYEFFYGAFLWNVLWTKTNINSPPLRFKCDVLKLNKMGIHYDERSS